MCQDSASSKCFVIKNRTHATVVIPNCVRHDTGTYEEQQIDFYFQRWTFNAVSDTVTTFIKQIVSYTNFSCQICYIHDALLNRAQYLTQ